jgi:hypothetical protein
MLRRRLVWLLVVYVLLDFANPFMPGAVTFEGGTMDTATVECHRPVASAPLAVLPSVQAPTVVPPSPSPSPSSPVRISAAVRRPIPTARHLAPLEPASPAEDH